MSKKTQPTFLGSLDYQKIDYRISRAVSEEIEAEQSDRGCGIMASAYLEEFLTVALRQYMVMDEKISEPLFDLSGALGTFSAKTKLAFALSIVGRGAYSDMNQIREIRNRFAHFLLIADGKMGLDQVTFKSEEIRDRCKALRFPEEFRTIREYAAHERTHWLSELINKDTINNPRMRFVGTCMGLAVALQAQRLVLVTHDCELIKRSGLPAKPVPIDY